MQRGKLRHRLTIEEPVKAQDSKGQIIETWVPVATRISAEVLPDRAGEFFGAAQVQATTNALIRISQRDGITPKMRAVHHVKPGHDEYWDIQGVVPFQYGGQEIRLMCLKREAEGFRRGTDLKNAGA